MGKDETEYIDGSKKRTKCVGVTSHWGKQHIIVF